MIKCKKKYIGYIARASYYGGHFDPYITPPVAGGSSL